MSFFPTAKPKRLAQNVLKNKSKIIPCKMTPEDFTKPERLSEEIAYLNGYLDSIAVLNTIPNNGMEHWIVKLDIINDDLIESVKVGINAPNWIFKVEEVLNWQESMEKECYSFFSSVLYHILGSQIYYFGSSKENQYILFEKYNLKNQLISFIHVLGSVLTQYHLSAAYMFEIDSRADSYNPYFAHGEINYGFKISDDKLLYLHLGAWD